MSANKRNRGSSRRKERANLQGAFENRVVQERAAEQEVKALVEIEVDKQSELQIDNPGPDIILPAQLESAEPATVETIQVEQKKVVVEQIYADESPKGQKSGGKRVAENNREGIFESLTRLNESFFSFDGVKKVAAWYIETSEKLANQALELQERAAGWAKDTPFAPLFEAQQSLARQFVERSATAARTLWQIQPTE